MRHVFVIIALSLLFFSCERNRKGACTYTLNELLRIDTPDILITYLNDSVIEARDKSIDTISFGEYVFDERKNIRSYIFFKNEKYFRYAEEYDSEGNFIKSEGSPFLTYKIFNGIKDTMIFNGFLFALNKKYDYLEVLTNKNDTIRPQLLFKCDIYSNVKCFSFKLPVKYFINDLIIYTKVELTNVCSQIKLSYHDTTSFKNIKIP